MCDFDRAVLQLHVLLFEGDPFGWLSDFNEIRQVSVAFVVCLCCLLLEQMTAISTQRYNICYKHVRSINFTFDFKIENGRRDECSSLAQFGWVSSLFWIVLSKPSCFSRFFTLFFLRCSRRIWMWFRTFFRPDERTWNNKEYELQTRIRDPKLFIWHAMNRAIPFCHLKWIYMTILLHRLMGEKAQHTHLIVCYYSFSVHFFRRLLAKARNTSTTTYMHNKKIYWSSSR